MTDHPTADRLDQYIRGTLAPEDLLLIDDHLTACDACRHGAAVGAGTAGRLEALQDDLRPIDSHLSDDELDRHVGGSLPPAARARVDAHVTSCATCSGALDALRGWSQERLRPRRLPYYAAAAAAVVLALIIPALLKERARNTETPQRLSVAGLDTLPGPYQEQVRRALSDGVATVPADLADLQGRTDVLMGAPGREVFTVVEPIGTVVLSDRPTFRWRPLEGGERYRVAVLDESMQTVVVSPDIVDTFWTPTAALPRGRTYVWQVSAQRGPESVTAPSPPAPMAKLRVLDHRQSLALDAIATQHPDAHLLLGILYAQAGVREAAQRHLRQIPPGDPYAAVANRTLDELNH